MAKKQEYFSLRQSEKETVVSPYNSELPGTQNIIRTWRLELQNFKLLTRYRVYGEYTGLLQLRQGMNETVDSPYNSEPSHQNSELYY